MSQSPEPWVTDGYQHTEWLTSIGETPVHSPTELQSLPAFQLCHQMATTCHPYSLPFGKAPVSHLTKQKGNGQVPRTLLPQHCQQGRLLGSPGQQLQRILVFDTGDFVRRFWALGRSMVSPDDKSPLKLYMYIYTQKCVYYLIFR